VFVLFLATAVPPRSALGWGGGGGAPTPGPAVTAAPAATPAASAPGPSGPAPAGATATETEGPMRPEAAALYARGLERFGARDYAGAIGDLEAGYAIDPRREFLFAEGQAKRLAGDCKGAIVLYQRFLATHPSPVHTNATQIALGRCAQHLAEHPDVVVVETPRRPPPPPPPPRWWRDPWGIGFTGAGVVSLGVGVGFIAASYSARHDADDARGLETYAQRWATVESRWQVGVGTLALGTVLTATGVTRFLLVRRQAREMSAAPPPVSVSIGPGTLRVGGWF
jgi:hypothetical protein